MMDVEPQKLKQEMGHFFVIQLLPFLAAQDELLLRNTLFHVSKGVAGGNTVTFISSSYLSALKTILCPT